MPHGLTRHHILPRSRGGDDDAGNITKLAKKKHNSFHICFGNDTPEEVVAKMLLTWEITCPFEQHGSNLRDDRLAKRRKAWRAIFEDASREEAIQIVISDFGKGRKKFIKKVMDGFNVKIRHHF